MGKEAPRCRVRKVEPDPNVPIGNRPLTFIEETNALVAGITDPEALITMTPLDLERLAEDTIDQSPLDRHLGS
jgi:hypothetical protein